VLRRGDAPLLGGWLDFLAASVEAASRRDLVGPVRVVVAGTGGSAPTSDEDDPRREPFDSCVVRTFPLASSRSDCHNELFASADGCDFVLLASPAAVLSRNCLGDLLLAIGDPEVGLAEARQLPLESRKEYDADDGCTSWASSTCCVVRRRVIDAVGGFDAATFPGEGADVDLSWRARLAGWLVRRAPTATVLVRSHTAAGHGEDAREPASGQVKLLLVAKYGGAPVAQALAGAWAVQGTERQRMAAADFEQRRVERGVPELAEGSPADLLPEALALEEPLDPRDELPAPIAEEPAPTVAPRGNGRAAASAHGPESEPVVGERAPFLSVVLRTQGRRPLTLHDVLFSLSAQTCQDFEVLLVGHDLGEEGEAAVDEVLADLPPAFLARIRSLPARGGGRARPLNVALDEACGRYVAFIDDDDVAFDCWVEAFRLVADAHPGSVVRTRTVRQYGWTEPTMGVDLWRPLEPPEASEAQFNLLGHVQQNGTAICALAVPAECFRDPGLRFREDLPVLEDWDLVLKLAQRRPIRSTGLVSVLQRLGTAGGSWEVHTGEEWDLARSMIWDELEAGSFVVRGEYLPQVRAALDELDDLRG